MPMHYLDNGATTFPKPRCVIEGVNRCMRFYGGNPGRSGHFLSLSAGKIVYDCREQIASLLGGLPERVVLTENATYALNIALTALWRGGEILISDLEHNAVYRPVFSRGNMKTFSACDTENRIVRNFCEALTEKTGLVVCLHASNICGITLPIEKIGKICSAKGIPFIVDASQSAGIHPIHLEKMGISALCAPGHKGLYGPQGCGFVIFSSALGDSFARASVFAAGGNGVDSGSPLMPAFLPERYEAGTLPTPALAGLAEGIRFVKETGIDTIRQTEFSLAEELVEGLLQIPGVSVYRPKDIGGTVLFNVRNMPSERVTEELSAKGICVRGGLHCCPLGHKAIGTGGGAVRASFSVMNRRRDVTALLSAISKLCRAR